MIDMIGVGPFITIPLIVTAMGGPQAMLGWLLGAALAVCDGLVWAELGAAMPGSGGSYRYLKEIYGPQKLGRAGFVSLYLATLVQRSAFDCLGSRGALAICRFLLAGTGACLVDPHRQRESSAAWELQLTWVAMPATLVAIGVCLLTAFLLYRRITAISRLSTLLWVGVMGTIGWIIFAGPDPFQRPSGVRFSSGRVFVFAQLFSWTGRGHADRRLRHWGVLQRLFSRR